MESQRRNGNSLDQSLRTSATTALRPGAPAPATGIYVVCHKAPTHAQPHEVLITAGTVLPTCNSRTGTIFSLRCYAPQPLAVNEFFLDGRPVLRAPNAPTFGPLRANS